MSIPLLDLSRLGRPARFAGPSSPSGWRMSPVLKDRRRKTNIRNAYGESVALEPPLLRQG